MIEKDKCDPFLGVKIRNHLISLGIETPINHKELPATDEVKITEITHHMSKVMQLLGLDLSDDSLQDTPKRIAKMFVNEIFYGLKAANFPKCTTVQNKMEYGEMVTVEDIQVMSTCEHHLVTIDGKATVSYIPKDKVLGLSKINRIVDYFSRRPQVQERLIKQIHETLKFILETDDVAVSITAVHYCVKSRGVGDLNSKTTTTALSGSFKEGKARDEFFSMLKKV